MLEPPGRTAMVGYGSTADTQAGGDLEGEQVLHNCGWPVIEYSRAAVSGFYGFTNWWGGGGMVPAGTRICHSHKWHCAGRFHGPVLNWPLLGSGLWPLGRGTPVLE